MQIQFTVNCVLDIPSSQITARVLSVVDANTADVSDQFFAFCKQQSLPLTTEDEIREAIYSFGRSRPW